MGQPTNTQSSVIYSLNTVKYTGSLHSVNGDLQTSYRMLSPFWACCTFVFRITLTYSHTVVLPISKVLARAPDSGAWQALVGCGSSGGVREFSPLCVITCLSFLFFFFLMSINRTHFHKETLPTKDAWMRLLRLLSGSGDDTGTTRGSRATVSTRSVEDELWESLAFVFLVLLDDTTHPPTSERLFQMSQHLHSSPSNPSLSCMSATCGAS